MNWQEYITIAHDFGRRSGGDGEGGDAGKFSARGRDRDAAGAGGATRKSDGGVVELRMSSPLTDPGWFGGAVAPHFKVEFELFIGNLGRAAHDRQTATYLPNLFSTAFKPHDERPAEDKPIDFTFVNVTTPNAKGFVSFGPHQWNKRMYARRARHAIAEVDANMTRTYGDVYDHVSEFEYFVEGTPPPPDQTADRKRTWLDGR